ncbi:unnamed protein product [Microthlaspi erraticum]|uniref:Uncharacterized protein n=1 Tax=Microthlaspi erraticum TaxID=1685480 RepID=A0A6D2HEB3_9BRAS|nr:unnamed protein product [Microthlaspi erraticum]
MSKLMSLEFEALDISGDNYLAWALDGEIHLSAKELGETIKEGNKAEAKDNAKAMIFLRHHLHEDLKNEYLNVKDPQILWNSLKERYDHQKTVILPRARYDWTHLRLQDFKSVAEYNSALFKITSKLELCGEKITEADKLEKTFSTFHANNVVLQTQYREKGFQKYSQLISCLLVAEQNNELLMKNHGLRPTGSAPFPEANVTTFDRTEQNHSGRATIVVVVVVAVVVVVVTMVMELEETMVEVEEFPSKTHTLTKEGETEVATDKHHKQMCVTDVEEKTIGLVCAVHQSIWLSCINSL